MFANSKAIVFEPYGRRRSRTFLPRWLMLLLVGAAIGAGGVVFVQERYLPERLSADASARLKASFEQADAERARLHADFLAASQRLDAAAAESKALALQLAARSEAAQRLRQDVAALLAALPPDPRGGPIAVRAARFAVERGTLAYDVVVSRERPGSSPLGGVLQFVVAGASEKNASDSVTLKAVPISVDRYDSVHGNLPLPQGFRPRQTTIHVLDRVGGKLLGMRVINVK